MQPDEIYNLGAMSHVKVSFEMSEYTAEADGVGVLRLLNAIRSAGLEKKTRLYQVREEDAFFFKSPPVTDWPSLIGPVGTMAPSSRGQWRKNEGVRNMRVPLPVLVLFLAVLSSAGDWEGVNAWAKACARLVN